VKFISNQKSGKSHSKTKDLNKKARSKELITRRRRQDNILLGSKIEEEAAIIIRRQQEHNEDGTRMKTNNMLASC
jgi:hypothetical protein